MAVVRLHLPDGPSVKLGANTTAEGLDTARRS